MSRRRQRTSPIHRWSRYAIAAIAILGAINTGYLTITKLFGGEAICPTSGCDQVLSSPYAYVFGLPLALFGLLAYLSMTAFALVPLAVNTETNRQLRARLEDWTWLLMFAGATAMMVFSGYLMYIMGTEFVAVYGFQSICYYCVASAIFATTLFILTLIGRDWEDVGQLALTGVVVIMVVLIGTLGIYADVGGSPATAAAGEGEVGPPVTRTSGQSELALARHLRQIGAKMYGAYWCPHCHDQKQLFGQPASEEINYVECDPTGQNAQPNLCEAAAARIEERGERFGFPTWEINGELYPGTRNLDELADLSGYQGPRNFQN